MVEAITKSEAPQASWQTNVVNALVELITRKDAQQASRQRNTVYTSCNNSVHGRSNHSRGDIDAHSRAGPFGLGANPSGLSPDEGAET